MSIKGFSEPLYVTRPLLPNLESVTRRLGEVWDSQWVTNMGNMHKNLERKLKEYLDVENLVLFNNGTLALLLGIKALGITGEVITTPFTFPATVQALDWNGLEPVFCDVDPGTLNIDADKIEALVTEKTSAILAVHVFGNPCDVDKINRVAQKFNLKVIYDGAHVFGSNINGRSVGTYGDMTMFSFHATKLFNTIEGGALAFSDSSLRRKLDLLKNFGIAGPEEVVLSGINAKMNELQAAIGLEVLDIVSEERGKRKHIKRAYEEGLADVSGIDVITKLDDDLTSYQYFAIRVDQDLFGVSRDFLHEQLKRYNVYTRKYFYPLCSEFTWYRDLPSAQIQALPEAHRAANEVLTLPFYGGLPLDSVKSICSIIRHIHSNSGHGKLINETVFK